MTMHQLEAKMGCVMCVQCGAYQYYNTLARANCVWKDNCGQGTEMQKKILKVKREERWSADDMWKLRLGLELT